MSGKQPSLRCSELRQWVFHRPPSRPPATGHQRQLLRTQIPSDPGRRIPIRALRCPPISYQRGLVGKTGFGPGLTLEALIAGTTGSAIGHDHTSLHGRNVHAQLEHTSSCMTMWLPSKFRLAAPVAARIARYTERSACRDRQDFESEAHDRTGGHLPALRRFDSADRHAVGAFDLGIEENTNLDTIDLTQPVSYTHLTLPTSDLV